MLRELLLTLTLFTASAAACAGQMVVASSSDPRHSAGTLIDGTQPLQVADGKSVTLIGQDGRTLRIDGPYRAAPDPGASTADDSILGTLSRLLAGDRGSSIMAVFRGVPRSTAATVVALDAGGVRCVPTDMPVRFSRRNPSAPGKLTLTLSGGGPSVHGPWPSGVREIEWPRELPVHGNARYTASVSSDLGVSEVQVLTVPGDLPSRAHGVAWMAERGCDRDARDALRRLTR